jgi:DNA (cytosine-5)-methyltransferase 1
VGNTDIKYCHRRHSPRQQREEGSTAGCGEAKSDWWCIEPNVGRVAYGVPNRVDRLRALGNAVVPQVAEWIGRRLIE